MTLKLCCGIAKPMPDAFQIAKILILRGMLSVLRVGAVIYSACHVHNLYTVHAFYDCVPGFFMNHHKLSYPGVSTGDGRITLAMNVRWVCDAFSLLADLIGESQGSKMYIYRSVTIQSAY